LPILIRDRTELTNLTHSSLIPAVVSAGEQDARKQIRRNCIFHGRCYLPHSLSSDLCQAAAAGNRVRRFQCVRVDSQLSHRRGWLQHPMDIGSVMTASIALGIAVDDTLHFLVFFRRTVNQPGKLAIFSGLICLLALWRCNDPDVRFLRHWYHGVRLQ
jgi:hypothetical protein